MADETQGKKKTQQVKIKMPEEVAKGAYANTMGVFSRNCAFEDGQ